MSQPLPKTSGPSPPKIDQNSFSAFDHAAAGHEGVLCHEDGSLIAKPCTQHEIDFYESSVHHPAFTPFMPTFIGTLNAMSPGTTTLPVTDISTLNSGTDTPLPPEVTESVGNIPVATASATEEEWVPSGGRKLETGLSIVLENVTSGFKRPNVLDAKLGARLWDDGTAPAKRARLDEVSRSSTSSTLGFRIAGMKTWVGGKEDGEELLLKNEDHIPAEASEEVKSNLKIVEAAGYRRYDKYYGRAFNEQNIKMAFESFLASAKSGKTDCSKLVADRLARKLRNMQSMLEKEESRMYSASVLVVYEGDLDAEKILREDDGQTAGAATGQVGSNAILDNENEVDDENEDDEDEEEIEKVFDIRLIDFAHARWTPGQGPDENALQGIRNLARIMEELAE